MTHVKYVVCRAEEKPSRACGWILLLRSHVHSLSSQMFQPFESLPASNNVPNFASPALFGSLAVYRFHHSSSLT